ncbi:MAG: substrate-binding domain-containing protein [Chloroflexota bacterium]|nr:substrate-binding domain-containing protein [Chloroflexota bacterium]
MLQHRWKLLSLALIGVIGIIAGVAYAVHPGETEVRVATMRLSDGSVEVAVQQRDADGSWGERQLPPARFLTPDVVGEWRVSSPVSVAVATAMADDAMSDAMSDASTMDAPGELYCIVHHGAANDPFWVTFNTVAAANAAELGLTNVEVHGEPNVADQAAAVMDCIDRGALGIASSIPDFDGMREALIAARTSGAFLVTFNSGAEFAGLVGSSVHYGLDDRSAGELAGRNFNDAGLTGTVLCVLHEPVNIGLEDRCDGLESEYSGSVERVQLPVSSLTDPVAAGTAIGGAIAEHEAAGVLVLNAELINTAIGTVQFLQSDAKVGAIGRSDASLVLVYEGHMLFAIDDGALPQASHVMLAMKNVDSSPSIRAMLALTATQAAETTVMLISPVVLNQAYIDNLPPGWQQGVCALAMQFAPGQVPSFCDQ